MGEMREREGKDGGREREREGRREEEEAVLLDKLSFVGH